MSNQKLSNIDNKVYKQWFQNLCEEIDKQRLKAVMQVPLALLHEMPILQARLANFTVSADGNFVQVPLAQITWYHHISMIAKVKDLALRAFYITETAIQGWSRDIMLMQIDDEYHKKARALPNNFDTTLPPVKSDLARAAFKDPYNLGFVDMTKVKQEQDLEDELASKVTRITECLTLCEQQTN